MNAYYKGMPVFGPRGPAGPDGNPIGTVISFLGSDAPKDYLVCDGTQYSISLYPALASFFEAQFGTKNHFGGDGETTFAVPDMRNLFLRGFHGEAEEQLSGDIGGKQEATVLPHSRSIASGNSSYDASFSQEEVEHPDSMQNEGRRSLTANQSWNDNFYSYASYTTRPVNMAVLYCIKAVESTGGGESAGETYSTEETRIGTWIDGKPLYRKAVSVVSPASDGAAKVGGLSADVSIVRIYGYLYQDEESCLPLPFFDGTNRAWLYAEAHSFYIGVASAYFRSKPVAVILEYTKPTDETANAIPVASIFAQPEDEAEQTESVTVLRPNPDFHPDLSVIASAVGSAGNLTVSFAPASYASAASGIQFVPASFAHASASAGISMVDGGNEEAPPPEDGAN